MIATVRRLSAATVRAYEKDLNWLYKQICSDVEKKETLL